MLMRFKESPDQSMVSPGSADKVMHAALRAGDAQILMSDGRCTGSANFHGIALALSAANDADAERIFNALAEGGKVNMPLPRLSFRRTSACWPTNSVSAGWSWWRRKRRVQHFAVRQP